jgi:hypothetical protein
MRSRGTGEKESGVSQNPTRRVQASTFRRFAELRALAGDNLTTLPLRQT